MKNERPSERMKNEKITLDISSVHDAFKLELFTILFEEGEN